MLRVSADSGAGRPAGLGLISHANTARRAVRLMAKDGDVARPSADRRRLGEILLEDGAVDFETLERAIAAQAESRARIGEILAARGGADRARIAAAVAKQSGRGFADLADAPGDEALVAAAEIELMLRHRSIPWRRDAERTIWAAADPDAAFDGLGGVELVHAEPRALARRLIDACGPQLAERSALRRPAPSSLRGGFAGWQGTALKVGVVGAGCLAAASPEAAVTFGLWGGAGVLGVNAALWGGALLAPRPASPPPVATSDQTTRLSEYCAPPTVTLIVPLYREPETAPLLLSALRRLDYPPELLDIKIVLESDDSETLAALVALDPPHHVEILIAPDGAPRTKPRALNFALDFARGEIVGVYDAEDHPPPDQIRKVVAEFAAAPPDVACIQARLGYYNAAENWLTRCFEIEYASWFDAMLPGLHRFGMPIPLGGTSLFLRRGALEAVGGWDSWNVTEDADLGMMLARAGFHTRLSDSLTEEEAASRPRAWIRQRSRWLKGYLATWSTHMRRPRRLLRELGPWRFVGFSAVLLSAALGYLLLPWLWLATLVDLAFPIGGLAGEALRAVASITAATFAAMLGAAALGLHRRNRFRLIWLTPTLPAYWVLGSVAAYLAVWELAVAPFRWRKTQHGVGKIAKKHREAALQR